MGASIGSPPVARPQFILPVGWVKNFFVSSSMQVSIISNSTLVKSLRVIDPVSNGLQASMNSSMGFVSLGIITNLFL